MSEISIKFQVKGLVTFYKAADILGVTRPNIYHLVEIGKLHRIDIGETAYVLMDEVNRLKTEKKPETGAVETPVSQEVSGPGEKEPN